MNNLYDQNKFELEYVAGDKPGSKLEDHHMDKGISTSVTVKPYETTYIRYRDIILESELYKAGDELTLHMMCPKCRHALKISSKNKQMDWDGKYISVERSGCTWELDTDIPTGVFTISNLCNWKFYIDRGMAKDG